IAREQPVDYFFMIRSGRVDVVLLDKQNQEYVVSNLGEGEFFGELELLRGGKAIANVRAGGSQPVETLIIPRADFMRVMNESPVTAEAIAGIVQERLEQRRTEDRRAGNGIGKQ
ncbi:MAG: cyclic nucleotide-binding domain-containing protein, partial [Chloroflexi bacterium]|nr:cyclic nucleotide-binding domain-containing protein [Chloroflexota bacterium]